MNVITRLSEPARAAPLEALAFVHNRLFANEVIVRSSYDVLVTSTEETTARELGRLDAMFAIIPSVCWTAWLVLLTIYHEPAVSGLNAWIDLAVGVTLAYLAILSLPTDMGEIVTIERRPDIGEENV